MADSFNKKDRESKKRKKKKEKKERLERKKQQKLDGDVDSDIMYVDADGNLTSTPPDPTLKKEEIKLEDILISIPKDSEREKEDPIKKGSVKFFNTDKGYGFIVDKMSGESYFTHADNLIDEIRDYDKVIFEIGQGPRGPIADKVKLDPEQ